jgi:hypothetical protein
LKQANDILNKPIVPFNTTAYLNYKTTGSRQVTDDNQYARYKKLFHFLNSLSFEEIFIFFNELIVY